MGDELNVRIKLLHIHSPHLLWVEYYAGKHLKCKWRQIGLFGVVPTQAHAGSCKRWEPAANNAVLQFAKKMDKLYFKLKYSDEDSEECNSTSIFSHGHMFGEITGISKSGAVKILSETLEGTGAACVSKKLFFSMLMAANIETRLNVAEAEKVLVEIYMYYQNKGTWCYVKEHIYKRVSPFLINMLKTLEKSQMLTAENLESYQRKISQTDEIEDRTVKESPVVWEPCLDFNQGSESPRKKVQHIEDVLEKHLNIVQIDLEPTKSTSSGGPQKPRVVLYNDELHQEDTEEMNNNGSDLSSRSQKSLGRATRRMKYTAGGEQCRPFNTLKEIIKFENLKKLKERGIRGKDPHAAWKETSNSTQQMATYKPPGGCKENKGASCNEVPSDHLIAYGPPMCDRKKFVTKKQTRAVENQIPKENLEDTEKLWKERNIDSGDEQIENGGKVHINQISYQSKTYLGNDNRGGNKEIQLVESPTISSRQQRKQSEAAVGKSKNAKLLEIMRKRKAYIDLSSTGDSKSLVEQNHNDSSSANYANTTASSKEPLDSDDDDISEIQAKLNSEYKPIIIPPKPKIELPKDKLNINTNPHKNLDGSRSVFVEDMVAPLLLTHTKNDNKIKPRNRLRDIPFKAEIHVTLQNMRVKEPSRLQSVSWAYILRGHSVFMIGGAGCGKTIGYLPSVCNLVMQYNFDVTGQGPICIIICATTQSVIEVAKYSTMFLSKSRVLTCYPGMDNGHIVTMLLNGCDVLVTTPSMLCRLLGVELGVDLRRLTTVVFDDCERLDQVYDSEVKAIRFHVKQMLKTRADKKMKVQYVLASRMWCGFMEKLAKSAPDTIVTFVAFQECVLYSKTRTSVAYIKGDKVSVLLEFLKETEESKLTVIVCRKDDEVDLLEKTLKSLNYTVVACNNKMTVLDLYRIRTEGYSNSILICCDGNLSHVNVTNASYLVHYSMPALYSQFCARFSVLNENYPSIFGPANDNIKIKILIEDTNVEQLPKILAFVKRCTRGLPDDLNEISRKVIEQKDLSKAQKLVPICDRLLSFGNCVDAQTFCQERHAILGGYDDPKDWLPCYGTITFKITHYHSAVSYSARLLTHEVQNNRVKYPDYCRKLSMNLGIYFAKDQHKRLHGEPTIGDMCAVFVRQNFVARCKVLKVMSIASDKAKQVLVNMVDEERLEIVRAAELHHLPDEFKSVETHIVKVRLANIQPQDKDLTFSDAAKNRLEKITDGNDKLFLKSRIIMAVGNCIFVENLVACVNLSDSKTVVEEDFKDLLMETHAENNPNHVDNLKKLCEFGKLQLKQRPQLETFKPTVYHSDYSWAYLEKNDWSEVIFSNTVNAGKFFVRLQKFEKCVGLLIADIRKYVDENPKPVESVAVRDVVLAEFPEDAMYERAIIEEIIDDTKVLCFFVDNADWREVYINKLKPIPEKYIKQLPFQAIECRLLGVRPPGSESWPEFSTNWLDDNCLVNDKGGIKKMFVKYFTKENSEVTKYKFGVVLVDTSTDTDVVINKRLIQMNLAAADEGESEYLEKPLDFMREKTDTSSEGDGSEPELGNNAIYKDTETLKSEFKTEKRALIPIPIKMFSKINQPISDETTKTKTVEDTISICKAKENVIGPHKTSSQIVSAIDRTQMSIFSGKLLRSVPLVNDSDEDSDVADVCFSDDLRKCFGLLSRSPPLESTKNIEHNNVNKKDYSKNSNAIIERNLPALVDTEGRINNVTKETELETPAEDCDYPKILDIREEVRNIILKDTSFHDSESTLSISDGEDFEEAKENERSVLDSDDLSVLTDRAGNTDAPADSKEFHDVEKNRELEHKPKIIEIMNESKTVAIEDTKARRVPNISDATIKNVSTIEKNQYERNSNEIESRLGKRISMIEITDIRKPQLTWKQDKHFVTVKIKLVVNSYEIETTNRSLKFEAYQNEVRYAFQIELYGVVENGCSHSNKGQYILVTLKKLKSKSPTWLTLAKGSYKNWIVYDVDSITTDSSDDDEVSGAIARKIILDSHERAIDDGADEIDEDDQNIDDLYI